MSGIITTIGALESNTKLCIPTSLYGSGNMTSATVSDAQFDDGFNNITGNLNGATASVAYGHSTSIPSNIKIKNVRVIVKTSYVSSPVNSRLTLEDGGTIFLVSDVIVTGDGVYSANFPFSNNVSQTLWTPSDITNLKMGISFNTTLAGGSNTMFLNYINMIIEYSLPIRG